MGNCIHLGPARLPTTAGNNKTRLSSSGSSNGGSSTPPSPSSSTSTSTVTSSFPPLSLPSTCAPSCLPGGKVDVTAKAAVKLQKQQQKGGKQSAAAAAAAAAAGAAARSKVGGGLKRKEWGLVRPRKEGIQVNYVLGEVLGQGNTAVVRECMDKRNGKNYALKIFEKARLSLVDVSGLLEEVSILYHLKHPNVIRFHDCLEDEWHYFLVTELMGGGELFDRIAKKNTYTEKLARDLFKVLVSTIEYLHYNDVVHRDLKPENLLLKDSTNDVHIKLADFGYAVRILGDEHTLRSQCGTPCYVAPEILKKEPYGKPVDMWSIGVILYILLAGYAPFYDDDQRRLFMKIKRAQLNFPQDTFGHISPEAQDLIRRLLCADPDKRLTPRQALYHPWVLADDELLRGKSLESAQEALKRFNARRKFRAGVHSVMAANKFQALMRERSIEREKQAKLESVHEEAKDEGKQKTGPQ